MIKKHKTVSDTFDVKGVEEPDIPINPAAENHFPQKAIPFLKKLAEFEGVVVEKIEEYYIIEFEAGGHECLYRKKQTKNYN